MYYFFTATKYETDMTTVTRQQSEKHIKELDFQKGIHACTITLVQNYTLC